MIKLCIFDLDGTVLNTLDTIAYYGNRALENNGVQPIEPQAYRYLVGTGIKNLIRKMLFYRDCYSDGLFKKVYLDYDTAYNADTTYLTVVYDGLHEVLDTLKAKGIRLAIVSNKPDFAVRSVVTHLFGEDYFDDVTGQKPGGVLKPDPFEVLALMERRQVMPAECLYLGDTSTDMLTGKAAGIFTIGVAWGFRELDELLGSGADAIIRKPKELLTFVE